jgi:prepilin-type processing-associated H-X9-DG protein
VRTLRIKLKHLADQEQAFSWSAELCKEWMMAVPEDAAVLYVDGHVRVYHGHTKQLPKHYIARQRLCLSATADYWVNAMDGKPFFVVSQPVDPGMLQVLERDIIPRLNRTCRTNPPPSSSMRLLCFIASPWCSIAKVTAPASWLG